MSNRKGDIIPDSKRREAIGAIGEDHYLTWVSCGLTSVAEVQTVNAQVGDDTVDLEGIALIGSLKEGSIISLHGHVYRVLNEVKASSNKMTGVKIYPSLREIKEGYTVKFYPTPVWRKWSEVVTDDVVGRLSPDDLILG